MTRRVVNRGGVGRAAWTWVAAAALTACVTPRYQPHVRAVGRIDASAFDRIVEVVALDHPRLKVDRDAMRLRSGWTPCSYGETAGRRRVTVWVEAGRVAVVAEVSWLRTAVARDPWWSTPEGDPRFERELGARIVEGLEASRVPVRH